MQLIQLSQLNHPRRQPKLFSLPQRQPEVLANRSSGPSPSGKEKSGLWGCPQGHLPPGRAPKVTRPQRPPQRLLCLQHLQRLLHLLRLLRLLLSRQLWKAGASKSLRRIFKRRGRDLL